jgi:hypothetical protein
MVAAREAVDGDENKHDSPGDSRVMVGGAHRHAWQRAARAQFMLRRHVDRAPVAVVHGYHRNPSHISAT